ncbi:MAG TPA: glycosyltransferase [Burkholderiaceae bacterium]|nr:glycosyltransferase [Burkholderiaceae bacterium]
MQGLSTSEIECIYAGPRDGWLGEQVAVAGFRCVHIPFHGMYDLVSLARLVRLIRRERADLVHGHLTRGALYAGWAARFASVPAVATAHSTNAGKHYGQAKRIIAVSNAVARFLAECGYPLQRLRTVHHGVPDYAVRTSSSPAAVRAELGLDVSPVLTMVARFQPAKGQDLALRALASLKDRRWTLVLAGAVDTPWAAEMKALAAELGIAARVRFAGHRDDVADIYTASDILIAPSRREALSLTLLEAAAFALPIVASDIGGIGEAVAHEQTGLLVPSENPAELARAIATLLDNVDLRRNMGAAGRKRYEQLFSLETMTQGTLAVYRELFVDGSRT